MRAHTYACIVACIFFALLPAFASADEVSNIAARIESLLARVAKLQLLLQDGSTTTPREEKPDIGRCFNLARNLGYGARGSDVSQLQKFLIEEGFLPPDGASGYFGELTEEAVKNWQFKEGIADSGDRATTGWGLVGAKTRASIFASCEKKKNNIIHVARNVKEIAATREKQKNNGAYSAPSPIALPISNATTSGDAAFISVALSKNRVERGETILIDWHSKNAPKDVRVEFALYTGNGTKIGVFAVSTKESGTTSWRLPAPLPEGYVCPTQYPNGLCGTELVNGSYRIQAQLFDASADGEARTLGSGTSSTLVVEGPITMNEYSQLASALAALQVVLQTLIR